MIRVSYNVIYLLIGGCHSRPSETVNGKNDGIDVCSWSVILSFYHVLVIKLYIICNAHRLPSPQLIRHYPRCESVISIHNLWHNSIWLNHYCISGIMWGVVHYHYRTRVSFMGVVAVSLFRLWRSRVLHCSNDPILISTNNPPLAPTFSIII